MSVHHDHTALAATFRSDVEGSTTTPDAYQPDVAFIGLFPDAIVRANGTWEISRLLADEAPGRTFDLWDVQPTPTGFAAEYAWRTTGTPSYLSVGTVLATVTDGRISRVVATCAGSWDAAAEAAITGASTAGASS